MIHALRPEDRAGDVPDRLGLARAACRAGAALRALSRARPGRRLHRPARGGADLAALVPALGRDPRRLCPARRRAAVARPRPARRRNGHEFADGARPETLPPAPCGDGREGRAGASDDRRIRRRQIDPRGLARRARLAADGRRIRFARPRRRLRSIPFPRAISLKNRAIALFDHVEQDRLGPLLAGHAQGRYPPFAARRRRRSRGWTSRRRRP